MRTSEAEVKAIVETDVTISLTPFLAVAASLVDVIAEQSASPDEDRLTLIETWLAAHFYCQRDVRSKVEKAGPVSQEYESIVALGLNNTRYGQMAVILDTSGYLSSLLGATAGRPRRTVGVYWAGKTQAQVEEELGET